MDRANKTKTPLSNFHPWQGFHVFQAASCEERIGKLFNTSRTTYRSS
ncbi:hypothetical protein [Methanosarcina sp. 1.H.A.2.2]|nr:hypothetical protein [Methanosarcina sp. 1.H.A.2.2]